MTQDIRKIDPLRLKADSRGVLKFATAVGYIRSVHPEYTICDSHEDIILTLSPQDIRNGVPRDPMQCAFAQAFKRQIHGNVEAMVFQRVMLLVDHDRRVATRYRTPSKIGDIINRFDEVSKMPAGDYKFSKMEKSSYIGTKRERKTGPHITTRKRNVSIMRPNYRHWLEASPEFKD